MTGWWTHLREIEAAAVVLQFTRRSDGRPLADLGVAVHQALPLPALMGLMGRDTLALFPTLIADSVYSSYATGNRPRRGYRSLREAIDIAIDRVRGAGGPTYTYLYTHRIDTEAHAHGIGHREAHTALHELDRQVERLRRGLGDRGRIVLTGDHGFLDAPKHRRHQLGVSEPVLESLTDPSLGAVADVHVQDSGVAGGREPQRFQDRFGDRFLLIDTAEAEELELFGPGSLSPLTRSRLGDLIAISSGADVIEYRTAGPGRAAGQASHHSGLSPDEMLVPLILA